MEDFLNENNRIPRCLEDYEQKVKCNEFDKIMVLGDYENSNISSCSINKSNNQLMILLRSDSNTKGCIHWFQFTVVAKEPCTVQFIILNNKRNGQQYKDGMKIAVIEENQNISALSESPKQTSYANNKLSYNWLRKSENIFYYKSNIDHAFYQQNTENLKKEQLEKKQYQIQKKGYQTLDFTYTFEKPGQRVVFAHSYAYTYTDLCNYINSIEIKLKEKSISEELSENDDCQEKFDAQNEVVSIKTDEIYYKKKIITNSRLGLPIHQIKITANKRTGPYKKRKRKVIYIMARQHPGESPGSFVCQGLINFLLSDNQSSKFLRSVYIFKIIPMVNPDGVVLGNTRCNLSGFDLNRKWQFPDKRLTPEVYFIKEDIKKTQQKREVVMFCDLHGHSQLPNFFVYGCNKATDGGSINWTKVRLLPHILAKRSEFFSLSDCRYKVTDERVSTARVTCWQELGIPYSFTIETSFYGYQKSVMNQKTNQSEKQFIHFTVEDLYKIGQQIGEAFLEQLLTLEKLQQELIQTKGKLNIKQKKHLTNITVNTKNNDNAIEENMKSTNNSMYNSSKSNTSKQKGYQQYNLNEKDKKQRNTQIIKKMTLNTEDNVLENDTNLMDSKLSENGISQNLLKNNQISQLNENSCEILIDNQLNTKNETNQYCDKNHPVISEQIITLVCPNIEKNWRDYFDKKDLENNFNLIKKGEDPNDLESQDGGSDSEPEADLFKENEWPFPIHYEPEEKKEDDNTKDSQKQKNQVDEIKKPIQIKKKKVFSVHTYISPPQQKQRYYYPISKVGQVLDTTSVLPQPISKVGQVLDTSNLLPQPISKIVEPLSSIKNNLKKKEGNFKIQLQQQSNIGIQMNNKNMEQNISQFNTISNQNDILYQFNAMNSLKNENIDIKEQEIIQELKKQLLEEQQSNLEQLSSSQKQNKTQTNSKISGTSEDERSNSKILKTDQIERLISLQNQQEMRKEKTSSKNIQERKNDSKVKDKNNLLHQSKTMKIEDNFSGGYFSEDEVLSLSNQNNNREKQQSRLNQTSERIIVRRRSNHQIKQIQKRSDSQNNYQIFSENSNILDDIMQSKSTYHQYDPRQHTNEEQNEYNKINYTLQDVSQTFQKDLNYKGLPHIRNSFRKNKSISQMYKPQQSYQNRIGQKNDTGIQQYLEKDLELVELEDYIKQQQLCDSQDEFKTQEQNETSAKQENIKLIQYNNQKYSSNDNTVNNQQQKQINQYNQQQAQFHGYSFDDNKNFENRKDFNQYLNNFSNNLPKNGSINKQMSLKEEREEQLLNEKSNSPKRDIRNNSNKDNYYQIQEANSMNKERTFQSRKGSRFDQYDYSMKKQLKDNKNKYQNLSQLVQNTNSENSLILPNIQQPNQIDFDQQIQNISNIDNKKSKNTLKTYSTDARNNSYLKSDIINMNNNSFNYNSRSNHKYNKLSQNQKQSMYSNKINNKQPYQNGCEDSFNEGNYNNSVFNTKAIQNFSVLNNKKSEQKARNYEVQPQNNIKTISQIIMKTQTLPKKQHFGSPLIAINKSIDMNNN